MIIEVEAIGGAQSNGTQNAQNGSQPANHSGGRRLVEREPGPEQGPTLTLVAALGSAGAIVPRGGGRGGGAALLRRRRLDSECAEWAALGACNYNSSTNATHPTAEYMAANCSGECAYVAALSAAATSTSGEDVPSDYWPYQQVRSPPNLSDCRVFSVLPNLPQLYRMRRALVATMWAFLDARCAGRAFCAGAPPPRVAFMTAAGRALDMGMVARDEAESDLMVSVIGDEAVCQSVGLESGPSRADSRASAAHTFVRAS